MPAHARHLSWPPRVLFWSVAASWTVPTLMFAVGAGLATIAAACVFAAIASAACAAARNDLAMAVLPFLALLSPMASRIDLGWMGLVLSDIYLVFVAGLMAWRRMKELGTKRPRGTIFSILLVAMLLLSFSRSFAVGHLETVKPLLAILTLAVVYSGTRSLACGGPAQAFVLLGWQVATVLACALLLHSYTVGIPLVEFARVGFTLEGVDHALRPEIYQASYFYANFQLVAGAVVLMAFVRLTATRLTARALPHAAVAVAVMIALVINSGKTGIFGAGIAALVHIALTRQASPWVRSTLAIAAIGMCVFGGGAQLAGGPAMDMESRLLRLGSAYVRWDVISTAVSSWLEHPIALLMGMGPDFLTDGKQTLAESFRESREYGRLEGAVDSGLVTYLIENGIPFVVVSAIWVASSLKRLRACVRRGAEDPTIPRSLLIVLIFFVVGAATQTIGYSKVSWLLIQILAMAEAVERSPMSNGLGRNGVRSE